MGLIVVEAVMAVTIFHQMHTLRLVKIHDVCIKNTHYSNAYVNDVPSFSWVSHFALRSFFFFKFFTGNFLFHRLFSILC